MIAGIVGTARAMFLSQHDFQVTLWVVGAAGVVSLGFALAVARMAVRDSRAVEEATRALGEHGSFVAPEGTSSELSRLSAQLAETSAKLAEANERERALETSRRELVAWVSHDLRTPLAGLRAMAEALEDGIAEDPQRYHQQMRETVDRMATELSQFAERSEDIGNCAQRAADAAARLGRWRSGLDSTAEDDAGSTAWIRWVDVTQSGWQLHASPLSVAEVFSKQVTDSGRAWIFTSATLAVGDDFSLYQRELGLGEAATGYWESPFDYARQALLYLPRELPEPNSFEHTDALTKRVMRRPKPRRASQAFRRGMRDCSRARSMLAVIIGV